MRVWVTSVALLCAGAIFAGPPGIPECFKVHDLLKTDQDHYWANWSNACPYTIDSVYVEVGFSDRSGNHLGDGVWALHFLPPGAHRVTRFSTPESLADFDSVHVRKITSSTEEALLHLPGQADRPADRTRPAIPEKVRVMRSATVSAQEHHRRGRQLIRSGDYHAAIAELSEAIREKPDFSSAYNARGFARYLSRDYHSALDDLDHAIRLEPNYLNAYQNRRQARKAAGDLSGSLADSAKIQELLRNSR